MEPSSENRTPSTSATRHHRWPQLLVWLACLACLQNPLNLSAGEWQLTYGQSLADYQATAQTLANQGFRPICLDADGTGDSTVFSAVWVQDGLTDWVSETDLTIDQLTDKIASRAAAGYRVLCLDSHGTYPNELYATVWVKDELAPGSVTDLRDYKWSSLNSYWNSGFIPTWFDLNVPASSSDRWFGTTYSAACLPWQAYYGMSAETFYQKLDTWSAWGWPCLVRSYSGGFAALWVNRSWLDSDDFRVQIIQTAAALSQTIGQYRSDGYAPMSVTCSSASGTPLYTTVWRRQLADLQLNRITRIGRSNSNQVQLSFQSDTPVDLTRFFEIVPLQASTNLVDWAPLATLFKTNASPAPLAWTDDEGAASPTRFFRVPTNRFITPLLPPTGSFAVGQFSRLLTDTNRFDAVRGTNVQFMVTCWYPAAPRSGRLPAPYVEEPVARGTEYFLPISRLTRLFAHASDEAPLATTISRCPVVVYSPGANAHRRENLMLVEELASQGFVVVGLDHRDTPVSVCPDGTLLRGQFQDPAWANAAGAQPARTADARFVLDTLAQWDASDAFLAGHLDLQHVGAFGCGLGGSTAASLANIDDRCMAAADLDGNLYDEALVSTGPISPYLMLRADTPDPDPSVTPDYRLTFFQHAQAAAYFLKFPGTCDFQFFEYGLLHGLDQLHEMGKTNATIDGFRAQDLARAALLSFFRRHLLGQEDGILDQMVADYPRP